MLRLCYAWPRMDLGNWILDYETLSGAVSLRSVILDSGRSGEKSRLSSFELKSHLLSASARTRDSGSRI